MNRLSPCRSLALLALVAGLLPAPARAQDVGADTPINDPTPPGVRIFPNLAYVEDGSPRQKLDLYLPFPVSAKPRPVILYLHGGGWQKGSKADGRRFAFRMVAQGYAVACADYRLSDEAQFPSQLEDCKVAVRWLRDNADRYRLDRDHFGVLGVSAGGYLATLLGLTRITQLFDNGGHLNQSSSVLAVCDFFGPVDLRRLHETAEAGGMPQAEEVVKFLGSNPQLNRELASRASPLSYLENDSPPFLIVHGSNDTVVPPEQSRLLYDALAKRQISVHLHLVRDAGHTGPAFVTPEVNAMVDAFFSRILKPVPRMWEPPAAILTEGPAGRD